MENIMVFLINMYYTILASLEYIFYILGIICFIKYLKITSKKNKKENEFLQQ